MGLCSSKESKVMVANKPEQAKSSDSSLPPAAQSVDNQGAVRRPSLDKSAGNQVTTSDDNHNNTARRSSFDKGSGDKPRRSSFDKPSLDPTRRRSFDKEGGSAHHHKKTGDYVADIVKGTIEAVRAPIIGDSPRTELYSNPEAAKEKDEQREKADQTKDDATARRRSFDNNKRRSSFDREGGSVHHHKKTGDYVVDIVKNTIEAVIPSTTGGSPRTGDVSTKEKQQQ
jgi:hypothetical protein